MTRRIRPSGVTLYLPPVALIDDMRTFEGLRASSRSCARPTAAVRGISSRRTRR